MENTNLYLAHHGIKGQKWGIRRYQNEDGSLTPEGEKRYGVDSYGNMSKRGAANYYRDIYKDAKASGLKGKDVHDKVRQQFDSEEEYQQFVKNYRKHKGKKAVAISLGTVGALAVTAAGAAAITTGIRKAHHDADVKRTQVAIQNAEHYIESSKVRENDYRTVLDDIRSGRRVNEQDREMYEILKGEVKYQHKETNKNLSGYRKNDLLTNTALQLRDQTNARTKAEAELPELKNTLENLMKKENRLRGISTMKHSYWVIAEDNYLCHHGIKGQKWGIRRFQNEDGSLTPEGMKRYGVDSSGNMSKSGAYKYYKDIYGNAKSAGLRGNDLHNNVRGHFNSEEEYQQFLRNYKNQKAKRIAAGIGIGVASAAAAGLATYGISKGVGAAKERKLVAANADRYGEMSIDDIIDFNKRAKEGMKTFNTAGARAEAAQEAKISEAIAKARLKGNEKQWNTLIKQSRKEKGSSQLDYAGIAERNIERATQMGTGSSLEKAYKKSVEKMAGSAAKEALRQNKKEYVGNIKIAALNQAKLNAGKEATANQVNAFSNALIGKVTTGAGTAIGGAAIGSAVSIGQKAVASMFDEQTASTVFTKPSKDRDKSSAITQPQTIDQAWKDRKKKKKEDEDDD